MTTKAELCRVGKLLAKRNMVHYLLGTISARNDTKVIGIPPTYFVKPAKCVYEIAKPSDFAEVDVNGEPLDGSDDSRPSLNFLVHLACYRARPDIGAVIHAHPERIVAFISRKNQLFEAISLLTQEAVWMVKNGYIPIVEDLDPEELAKAVAKEIRHANVVAIRNHGIIAVGQNLLEAYGTALVAESEVAMISDALKVHGEPSFRYPKQTAIDLEVMPPTFSPKFLPKSSPKSKKIKNTAP